MNSRLENARNKNIKTFASFFNKHLFMNSDNSDYIFFHINYDSPGEYQFLITLFTWLETPYKGVVLDKYLHKSISLLAINKVIVRHVSACNYGFPKSYLPSTKFIIKKSKKCIKKGWYITRNPNSKRGIWGDTIYTGDTG